MEALEKLRSNMTPRYLGAHTNKVDSKGRLSVPAEFRKSLESEAGEGATLFCFPAFKGSVIDCGGPKLLTTLMNMVTNHDYFDEDREVLEIAITSGIQQLSFDDNGRITLPKPLRDYAGLNTHATIVGLGERFQIWKPEAHQKLMAKAQQITNDNRDIFRARSLPSVSDRRGSNG